MITNLKGSSMDKDQYKDLDDDEDDDDIDDDDDD